MSSSNPRNHGLGIQGHPAAPPQVVKALTDPGAVCPHCECVGLYEITVRMVAVSAVVGGQGLGMYLGCAACPWAGPMVIVADPAPKVGV